MWIGELDCAGEDTALRRVREQVTCAREAAQGFTCDLSTTTHVSLFSFAPALLPHAASLLYSSPYARHTDISSFTCRKLFTHSLQVLRTAGAILVLYRRVVQIGRHIGGLLEWDGMAFARAYRRAIVPYRVCNKIAMRSVYS